MWGFPCAGETDREREDHQPRTGCLAAPSTLTGGEWRSQRQGAGSGRPGLASTRTQVLTVEHPSCGHEGRSVHTQDPRLMRNWVSTRHE